MMYMMLSENWKERWKSMEPRIYRVVRIDGDYANLKRADVEMDDVMLVARALLPTEIEEGSRLRYENFQYEIIE